MLSTLGYHIGTLDQGVGPVSCLPDHRPRFALRPSSAVRRSKHWNS